MEKNQEVTVTFDEYAEINRKNIKIDLLENAGVNKWEGYDAAIEGFESALAPGKLPDNCYQSSCVHDGFFVFSFEEHAELNKRVLKLELLEDAGVDHWDKYNEIFKWNMDFEHKQKPRQKTSYVTLMYRYGSLENHSYVVYIGDDKERALEAGEAEEELRGGKYSFCVRSMVNGDVTTLGTIHWVSGAN